LANQKTIPSCVKHPIKYNRESLSKHKLKEILTRKAKSTD